MDNVILNKMYEYNKNYCHALEVESIHDLQSCIDSIVTSFNSYDKKDIINFVRSLEIYSLNDTNDDEIYNAGIDTILNNSIENYYI